MCGTVLIMRKAAQWRPVSATFNSQFISTEWHARMHKGSDLFHNHHNINGKNFRLHCSRAVSKKKLNLAAAHESRPEAATDRADGHRPGPLISVSLILDLSSLILLLILRY